MFRKGKFTWAGYTIPLLASVGGGVMFAAVLLRMVLWLTNSPFQGQRLDDSTTYVEAIFVFAYWMHIEPFVLHEIASHGLTLTVSSIMLAFSVLPTLALNLWGVRMITRPSGHHSVDLTSAETELVMPRRRQVGLAALLCTPVVPFFAWIVLAAPIDAMLSWLFGLNLNLLADPSVMFFFVLPLCALTCLALLQVPHRASRARASPAGLSVRRGARTKLIPWERLQALQIRADGLYGQTSAGWTRLGGTPQSHELVDVATAYLTTRPPDETVDDELLTIRRADRARSPARQSASTRTNPTSRKRSSTQSNRARLARTQRSG